VIEVETWLYATTETVSLEGLRSYYKGQDASELVVILERSPSMRLGTTYVVEPDAVGRRGPVGRLDDALMIRGTSTWPPDTLPVLDDELARLPLKAFEPEPEDPPFDVATVAELGVFLAQHRGAALAYWSRPVE
jgi:hypothetical protein